MLWIISSLLMGCGEETERVSFDNLPPFSPIVDLQPAVPYTNDDLEALLVAESIDPNDDTVTLAYQWYKNDELQADLTGDIVSSDLTEVGDVWTISVIGNDGALDSADTRRSVTIRNSPPALTSYLQWVDNTGTVIDNQELQDLAAEGFQDFDLAESDGYSLQVVSSVTDIDMDEVTYTYAWTVDGTEVPSLEGDLLEMDQMSHGQEWIVNITANDGLVDSESVEITFDFFNTPPAISGITLEPEMPYLGDSILCEAIASDDEGDTIEMAYSWTITTTNEEGAEEVNESTENPIDTSDLLEGDSVQCRATADDGHDTSSLTTDTIALVVNTAPMVIDVTITPQTVDSTLSCSATISDSESDLEDLMVSYEWTDGTGTVLSSIETIDTTDMTIGDELTCTVTADDGNLQHSASAQATLN
jgi:hypothetical protein